VDAGEAYFKALPAEVILLNPSAAQLASWSISACRTAGGPSVAKCLTNLRNWIVGQNGAQFPVAGSVVESYCNSSKSSPPCRDLEDDDWRLAPRHTWFRDGVSVDYAGVGVVHWDSILYDKATFDAVLDVASYDAKLNMTYDIARIAAATRDVWIKWRSYRASPELPQDSVQNGGWRVVSASLHKAACSSDHNELFNAVVFANPSWSN
jgi:hypothetical protein